MTDGLVYLDASAVVKLVVQEPESDALRRQLRGATEILSAEIVVAETARAARRAAEVRGLDEGALLAQAEQLLEGMALLEVDRGLLDAAIKINPPLLRTLDSIHLAAGLGLAGDVSAFITYDGRLQAAAQSYQLPVYAPV